MTQDSNNCRLQTNVPCCLLVCVYAPRSIPAAVPGIHFLSGGMGGEDAVTTTVTVVVTVIVTSTEPIPVTVAPFKAEEYPEAHGGYIHTQVGHVPAALTR